MTSLTSGVLTADFWKQGGSPSGHRYSGWLQFAIATCVVSGFRKVRLYGPYTKVPRIPADLSVLGKWNGYERWLHGSGRRSSRPRATVLAAAG